MKTPSCNLQDLKDPLLTAWCQITTAYLQRPSIDIMPSCVRAVLAAKRRPTQFGVGLIGVQFKCEFINCMNSFSGLISGLHLKSFVVNILYKHVMRLMNMSMHFLNRHDRWSKPNPLTSHTIFGGRAASVMSIPVDTSIQIDNAVY